MNFILRSINFKKIINIKNSISKEKISNYFNNQVYYPKPNKLEFSKLFNKKRR